MAGGVEMVMSTDQLKALVIKKLRYESDEVTLTGVLTPAQETSIDEGLSEKMIKKKAP